MLAMHVLKSCPRLCVMILTSLIYLDLDDGTKDRKVIARFQQNLLNKKKAVIEVDDGERDMLDWIIITWIFIERIRREGVV